MNAPVILLKYFCKKFAEDRNTEIQRCMNRRRMARREGIQNKVRDKEEWGEEEKTKEKMKERRRKEDINKKNVSSTRVWRALAFAHVYI